MCLKIEMSEGARCQSGEVEPGFPRQHEYIGSALPAAAEPGQDERRQRPQRSAMVMCPVLGKRDVL